MIRMIDMISRLYDKTVQIKNVSGNKNLKDILQILCAIISKSGGQTIVCPPVYKRGGGGGGLTIVETRLVHGIALGDRIIFIY